MIDIRDHVYVRLRERFPKYKEFTDFQIKELITIAILDSTDFRYHKKNKNIMAVTHEELAMITETDGRNIKVVTVYPYGEESSSSWIYKNNLITRERNYVKKF